MDATENILRCVNIYRFILGNIQWIAPYSQCPLAMLVSTMGKSLCKKLLHLLPHSVTEVSLWISKLFYAQI